jgi:ssDNA-binding Zn-finger/Zn-ribbon topoisomerase 1
MADNKKKLVMIVIIVACVALAAAITFKKNVDYKKGSGRTGVESIKPTEIIWVICANPDCQAKYQTGKRAYFEYLEAHPPTMEEFAAIMKDPDKPSTPAACDQCGEKTLFRAEKCDDCGVVFRRGAVAHDFADRCTECGYSRTEAQREKVLKAREGE